MWCFVDDTHWQQRSQFLQAEACGHCAIVVVVRYMAHSWRAVIQIEEEERCAVYSWKEASWMEVG